MSDRTSKRTATTKASPAAGPDRPPAPTPEAIDHAFRAAIGKLRGGLSTTALASAWTAWAHQLSASSAQQAAITTEGLRRSAEFMDFCARAASGTPLSPTEDAGSDADTRFAADAWSQYPFNVWARGFQHSAAWLKALPRTVAALDPKKADLVAFTISQWLEALSPTNFLLTNPELLELTRREGGENLRRGAQCLIEDIARVTAKQGPVGAEQFAVGTAVATTPGKVIYRNQLMELLQYVPTTAQVYTEPILIVPAWIMKYYILDLSARNSLVKYLVDQGHTVFMISWKNPEPADRDHGMDDYLDLGPLAALDAINAISPGRQVHAAGYCIGGTLLAITAAALAARNAQRLASISLFAAQTDFSEPGALSLFINPDQLAMLKTQMLETGVLDATQMSGAFQMLRPRELVWQPIIQNYVQGQREPLTDLMAWNADGTRMPYKMHTEYLYRLYLDNELATGRFPVHGVPVSLERLTAPLFVVGTETDHVAPWKSVYKAGALTRSQDYTFLLTSGGHNAGIVSGPVNAKRTHRVSAATPTEAPLSADAWIVSVLPQPGSWWPVWQAWLQRRSSGQVDPPTLGAPKDGYSVLGDAPGNYVHG